MLATVARSILLGALALAAAGCGSSEKTIPEARLSHLVLRDRDLAPPFVSFYLGPQVRLDNIGTTRADPARFGREGGWIARYHRAGSTRTRGPLVVESRADLFESSGGASRDLDAYRTDFRQTAGSAVHSLELPKLGDEAVGITFVQPSVKPLRFFRIAWRDRNATASVTAQGFGGRVHLADAVALARAQERLIARG